jgi:hypothetical protein
VFQQATERLRKAHHPKHGSAEERDDDQAWADQRADLRRRSARRPSLPVQALAEFYKAFNTRDLALMAENWEPSEEAAMDNPVGDITRGWADSTLHVGDYQRAVRG